MIECIENEEFRITRYPNLLVLNYMKDPTLRLRITNYFKAELLKIELLSAGVEIGWDRPSDFFYRKTTNFDDQTATVEQEVNS